MVSDAVTTNTIIIIIYKCVECFQIIIIFFFLNSTHDNCNTENKKDPILDC